MKAGILGHFGEGKKLLNGQTIKTKVITEELQDRFGRDQILTIDTHGGAKTLLKAPFQVLSALKKCENVLIFPAHNGLRVYAPLLAFFNRFYRRKLHYVVIGGWLPEFLKHRKHLSKSLKRFDGIYTETAMMKTALEAQGFDNILVMPNCKKLRVLSEDELVCPSGAPYKLCTFSRVMREKGIGDAVKAVTDVNTALGYEAFSLDIYGQVDPAQTEWFDELKSGFLSYIRYGGEVPFDQSVEILKNYFALLFPTHFYTEGVPGTIIDAYAAGLPVIVAKWESYSDVVEDGKTGVGYDPENPEQLKDILMHLAATPETVSGMKGACLAKAREYTPGSVIRVLKIREA